jgi:hypothetical protein
MGASASVQSDAAATSPRADADRASKELAAFRTVVVEYERLKMDDEMQDVLRVQKLKEKFQLALDGKKTRRERRSSVVENPMDMLRGEVAEGVATEAVQEKRRRRTSVVRTSVADGDGAPEGEAAAAQPVKPKRRVSVCADVDDDGEAAAAVEPAAAPAKPKRRGSVVADDGEEADAAAEAAAAPAPTPGEPAPEPAAAITAAAGEALKQLDPSSLEYRMGTFMGFVNWTVELFDPEAEVWHKCKATKFNAATNMIFIDFPEMGMEGDVELDFEFIRLVACLDPDSQEAFEFLMGQQLKAAPVKKDDGPKHVTDVFENIEAIEWPTPTRRTSLIGVGLFGVVKLVQEVGSKKTLALKVLQKHSVTRLKQTKNVMSEKRVMQECQHPFICKLVDTRQDTHCLYMVLELIQGGELFHLLHGAGDADRPLEEPHAIFYTACILMALEFLHSKNWLYRDLKPENIMIDNEGYPKVRASLAHCNTLTLPQGESLPPHTATH